MADNSSVQSVERTFDIIENLSSAPQGLTLLELSSDVGLPKSTVHRLLSTLTGRGYITQDPESKKYLLTLKLFEISSRSLAGFDILSAARPYLQHLSRITNEAVHLVVREGHEVVYIYKEDSSKIRYGWLLISASIIPCTVPAWAKPSWPISPEANRSRSGKLRKSFLIPLKQ